ncbi:MAG: MFS transporter [Pseudomonadales bacterium]|nr:MFS transporter [Pseudomonadales bacterium]
MGPSRGRGGAVLKARAAPAPGPISETRSDSLALGLYLAGTASWFAAMGVQTVLFAWLVTVELHETPERVGLAQFALLLPTLCLILFAGAIADRGGALRLALLAQTLALLPVLVLAGVIGASLLSYGGLIAFAVTMGSAQAFLTPARDGLLPRVAGARIQRTVVLASLVQFGVQIIGYLIAGAADRIGAARVLVVEAGLLAVGVVAFLLLARRLGESSPPVPSPGSRPALRQQLHEGFATVFASPGMRMVTLINCAMGLFYLGAFQVGVPLLVREVHGGTPGQLAMVNGVHMVGVVLCTLTLLRIGDIERHGRALLVAILAGAVALTGMGLARDFVQLLLWNFAWGISGGVAMSMSRTVIQALAPATHRSRVMAVFTFGFMGAGPAGALLSGALVDAVGVHLALVAPAIAMAILALLTAFGSGLWQRSTLAREPAA